MNGSNYSDIDFSTNIEVGARGVFSESLIISLLDQLLQQQAIDVDDYIELYPDSIMTFKETLKKMRAKKGSSESSGDNARARGQEFFEFKCAAK